MEETNLKKTILYEKHLEANAKIVEFGGFLMPIEYANCEVNGITPEHLAVRHECGLFDVSHMGEIMVNGRDAMKFLDFMLTSDITNAPTFKMTYGLLCYPDGGVVDDLMVYKFSPTHVLLVVNASNCEKDFAWLLEHVKGYSVEVENKSDEIGQIALQGPKAIEVLQTLTSFDLNNLKLFEFYEFKINGKNMLVSRSGYTGEDGFEIYGKNDDIVELFDLLYKEKGVRLCGLGCRDTLRFEAAMPLYGHEISQDIKPVEACLNYAICYDKDFIGKDSLLEYKQHIPRKLVGIELIDRGIARGGYELVDLNNNEVIGFITTGYLLPEHDKALALGFVKIEYAELGTEIGVKIRHNVCKAVVRDRKFMNKKYVK